jgi:NAD(P) transhydrogenase subunit alpha
LSGKKITQLSSPIGGELKEYEVGDCPSNTNERETLIVGVPKESAADERRVSLIPDAIPRLPGFEVHVERGAGEGALYPDSAYVQKGAKILDDRQVIYANADILVKVQPPTVEEARLLKEGAALISFLYPVTNLEVVRTLAIRRVSAFAMDLIPRISRAQPIDALSSQATISGYKAMLLAADSLPKLFPMLMTAAGTIPPARVLIVGTGVAGLQAIATARRLGAIVEAYDIRPTVKEQVESLGAKFVELAVEAKEAEDAGGYAKAQTQEFYMKQQELLAERARASDVVITTALVPGRRAPVLISKETVLGMTPGSVVVDLAAEQGGNCALTEPGRTVVRNGVTIHGPLNLPSSMAPQASALYSRNVISLLQVLVKDGRLSTDLNDELVRGPLVTHNGEVLHQATKAALEGAS